MTAYTGGMPTFTAGQKTGNADRLNQIRDLGRAFTDAWGTWTPTLTATTTNPTGWTQTGYWAQAGKLVLCRFTLTAGQSMTPGSGYYEVALPRTPASTYPGLASIGDVVLYDSSSAQIGRVMAQLNTDAGKVRLQYGAAAPFGAWTAVAHNAPWAWAAGDVIVGQLVCEAA